MLKYIWMVIQDLFVAVSLTALMHALLKTYFRETGLKIHRAGIAAGVIASVILAIVKNTTNKIVSSRWNHKIYLVIVLFTLLFLLSLLLAGRKKQEKGGGGKLISLFGAGLTAVWIFYALPGSIAYPFTFNTMGNGDWSGYFMGRLSGWLLAYLLLLIYAAAVLVISIIWVSLYKLRYMALVPEEVLPPKERILGVLKAFVPKAYNMRGVFY